LVTTLAHDLRNYLAPLRAHLDLMLLRAQRFQRAEDVRDAEEALRGIERFTRLIEDLLDVARIDQGLFALNLQLVELGTLVREVALALQGPDQQILVEGDEILPAWVDANRLRQAIENLVGNALRHGAGTPVTVTVAREMRENHPWGVFAVTDQGPGVPVAQQPSLFRRFAGDGKAMGLGLGLYLAREIVVAHGGELSLDPTYSNGARFCIEIPMDGRQNGSHLQFP
jgi:signal transduction histidine kinase